MSEQLKVCADLSNQDRCQFAKIVEEEGKYQTISFQAKTKNGFPDLSVISNVHTSFDTTCLCVYCIHPSYSKGKFIEGIEPYFPCTIPSDCPLNNCSDEEVKESRFKRFRKLFIK